MKMSFLKKSTLLLSLLVLILGLQACDPFGLKSSGDLITLDFDESDFHGLDLCVSGNAEVHLGDSFKVEITCEETAMPYLETKVENGVLKVYFSRDVYDVDHLKVVVTAPSWDHFEVSGSGDVEVLDVIEGDELELDVDGSGSIRVVEAHFDKADLDVSGSGDLKIAGSALSLDCDISGSGSIKAFDFLVNTAHVEVSGSGDVQVNASETLDAEISGSGTIVYKGNPQVNARVSGSGKIRPF